jgi:1-acyl-sn-glycerol-3-phosphate acyltransferase
MADTHRHAGAPDEALVLETVRELAAELRRGASIPRVRPDTRLDAELGLDSLALVELRSRLEAAFDVELPDRILSLAATPGEWIAAIRQAHGRVAAPAIGHREAVTGVGTGDEGFPDDATTLTEALDWHTRQHPERVHMRIVHGDDDGTPEEAVTYAELRTAALRVAGGLHESKLGRGESVAVMLPTGRQYFEAFAGILLAGGVPVPIYPPARPAAIEDHLRRQAHILEDASAAVLIADEQTLRVARYLRPHVPTLRDVRTVSELSRSDTTPEPVLTGGGRTALVQYTSGSTGSPKGVVLTNTQVLANIRAMGEAAEVRPADVFVSWLPLYHDMGLIGAWMASMYFGYPLVVMPTLAFLARPSRWLRVISSYGGTLSASPNFGYELCLRHCSDAELDGVDLSSWRMALNGAEPVSPETIRRFTERFAPYGFRPEAMSPVYGLAEVGVGLCFPPLGHTPVVDAIERATLARSGRAVPVPAADARATHFVSCGRPLPGYRVRVVDPAGRPLGERREGRVECAGPSTTSGYLGNEVATAAMRDGEWLDTGDLGYVAGGDLYLTGRAKDIVIKAGRNLHPEELEEAVGGLPGVRKGCVAVFASADEALGTERLVVLAETRLTSPEELADLRAAINSVAVDLLGTPPDDVVLAPSGTVLKTSSGKIRRAASRQRYEAQEVGRPPSAPWWQITRFVWSGARARTRDSVRSTAVRLYAAYAWAALVAVGLVTWLAVAVLPTRRRRWWAVRVAGRALAHLVDVRFGVSGPRSGGSGPRVLVANHPSFIDSMAVALAVPEPLTFVAGDEFAAQHIAGPFLRRLGCEFVHRAGVEEMASDAARLTEALHDGHSLVFFPEGSLDRAPGVRPFHLGAFSAAVASGAPVVPLGIRGSRDVVRPGEKFPRHGAVEVVLGDPISPSGAGWQAILALRDEARAAVCSLSAEPEVS